MMVRKIFSHDVHQFFPFHYSSLIAAKNKTVFSFCSRLSLGFTCLHVTLFFELTFIILLNADLIKKKEDNGLHWIMNTVLLVERKKQVFDLTVMF